jgi:ABC-type nickel/cobalt efflux system permease component RcnA
MKARVLLLALLALATVAFAAPGAQAHPLGNFSINHLSKVSISADRVDVHYILDQAEIPTLQERNVARAELLARKLAVVERGLTLMVDGREAGLRQIGKPRLSFPPGAGGLDTTRLELQLRAAVDSPRRVTLADETFEERVGWKAIVAAPGDDTAVRTQAPSADPTNGLRRYPEDLLSSPLDRREASFSVTAGDGMLIASRAEGADQVSTSRTGSDGFAGLFERAAAGEGVLFVLLLAAFGWGAVHALSPGHGKAMVAAYLVGTKGKPRHAVALGATVTVAHTIGVFLLGLVTLALSQYVLPEDLYPWLNLISGALVVAIGLGVLRSRLRGRGHSHHGHHHHGHGHHHHHHDHAGDHTVTNRSLIGLGAAAGLIPCPSALVVLLGAIAQHEIALGLLLIVAFSLGLAATLTGLGLAVVYARKLLPRLGRVSVSDGRTAALSRVAAALPAASAVVIVGVGCLLTVNALPGLM